GPSGYSDPANPAEAVSFRVTVPCTRAQGEAVADADALLADADQPPVLVAEECHAQTARGTAEQGTDEARPGEWLIHAYFEHEPTGAQIARLSGLRGCAPRVVTLRAPGV